MNYEPNSADGPVENHVYGEVAYNFTISGVGDRYDHREDTDYYTQPGNLFRLMAPDQKHDLLTTLCRT